MKAVVFDWGGVFMRTVDYGPRHKWDDHLALPRGTTEQFFFGADTWRQAQLGELRVEKHWAAVGQELGLTLEDLLQFSEDFYAGDQLNDGLVSLTQELREQGILIGLLSNNILELWDEVDELGVMELFDRIIVSADIGVMKPNPAAYEAVLAALSVEPSEAVMIDDFITNVEGARAVGMQAVHFTPNTDLSQLLFDLL